MKLHSKVRIEEGIENESCATILVDPKTFIELKPTPKKGQKLNSTLTQVQSLLYLNSTLRQPQLNLNLSLNPTSASTHPQHQLNLNLKSNSGSSQP